MKKKLPVFVTIIACVICLAIGVGAALVIDEIRDEIPRVPLSNQPAGQGANSTPSANSSASSAEGKAPVQNSLQDDINFIGEEKAKEIALQRAGISAEGVIFDRVELDRDKGVWHYEVEFRQGRNEYDVNIKADDGAVISFETDYDD